MHQPTLFARQLLRRARMSWVMTAAAAALATPWIVRNGVGDLEQVETAPVAATVTQALDVGVARLASNGVAGGARATAATGRHLGFDTSDYPGDRTMQAWKDAGVYEWVGYYLPAPCHRDEGWSGKRTTLQQMGWGTAVVYVGQQTWDKVPNPARAAAKAQAGKRCDADFVSGDRGTVEAHDAIRRTAAEGFPKGTVVYLDVERMERMPETMRDYYRAWVRELLRDGRYVPGVYLHAHNARAIHADFAAEFAAAGLEIAPPVWVASGRNFHRGAAPSDVGHQFAGVWQGVLDVVEAHGGVPLPIDVNVAAVPSPSEQYAAVAE